MRKKLKEYAEFGVLQDEKHGRLLYYRLAEDGVDLSAWEDAAAFFSEEAPLLLPFAQAAAPASARASSP